MTIKYGSIVAFAIAVIGILFLLNRNYVFSANPIAIILQVCAFALMVWARLTFGLRSFHASANTTKGELITKGPYGWFRHPIYAAVIYFFWSCLISYPHLETLFGVLLITGGLFVRMLLEEKSLMETYLEYPAYSKRTKRIIPFVF